MYYCLQFFKFEYHLRKCNRNDFLDLVSVINDNATLKLPSHEGAVRHTIPLMS